ncbi:MAG: hypothetical protein HKP30_00985 [Myxococcales bacterium]|nr:hypothetical protein [Myxococcales bacterium]
MRTGHYIDPAQLFLSVPLAIGGLLWIITYILIIRRSHKDRAYGLPLFAICLNITWESLSTAACTLPGNPLELCPKPAGGSYLLHLAETAGVLVDVFWLGLDVILFHQLWKFGRALEPRPQVQRHWHAWLIGLVALFLPLHYGFVTYYDDTFLIVDGWIINMIMSMGFVFLLYDREKEGLRGLSWAAAWTKMFANLFYAAGLTWIYVVDAANHIFPPGETQLFMYVMFAGTFVFDVIYIRGLGAARRAAAGGLAEAPA